MKTISKSKSKFIPVNTPKIYKDEKKYVNKCLTTGWISSEGKYVKEFEKRIKIRKVLKIIFCFSYFFQEMNF